MSLAQAAVDRLRAYLGELKPASRAMLIAELERSQLRGDEIQYSELVLTELRRSFRASGQTAQRLGDPARLFFQPLEPFLIDGATAHPHEGRVIRTALDPMWKWLSKRVMPEEVTAFTDEVEQALLANDTDRARTLARGFQDRALELMQAALLAAENDDRAERRLGVHVGTPNAMEHVKSLVGVLNARDGLANLGEKLHGHIQALAGSQLETVKSLLDAHADAKSDLFRYGLVLLIGRLAAPWQLVRLSTKAAGTDLTAKVSETPYAIAVDIVLAEIDRMVAELSGDLKSGRGVAVVGLLKDIHDSVRGLRSELDLSPETRWGRQLATVRAHISKLLTTEIELVPGRVRRLLRPRPSDEITVGAVLDDQEVTEVEALIGFVIACRNYASELAINEVTQRAYGELQQQLDTGTRSLLDALRGCSEREQSFRQSQVDAAVRFCGRVFGQDYAVLLIKAADVAAQDGARRPVHA